MSTTITLKKTFASLPRTTRGQFIVINGDPKGKNFLYCNGSQIYVRNIEDTSVCDVYAEHGKETTVAKYSPSGFYIASADVSGKVRVWDTVNEEHILKIEHSVIAGSIKDLDWSADSQRICAGGLGKELFARVFTFDSGNNLGELLGHSKCVNSVSLKPSRPFKLVTGGEDFTVSFFEGPPFKFSSSKREANNFVNCVRYAPNGEFFVTASQEGKMWMYDGKTSELICEIGDTPKAHNGGIYSVCFSADSKKLLSVSGDKTAKIWDMESRTCETEFVMGTNVMDMQVGCLLQGDHIVTVSLSGNINFLDKANPSVPKKIVKGHNKPITALDVSPDGSAIYSASYDGLMLEWDSNTSIAESFSGKGHTNQVVEVVLDGDTLVSAGMDDTVRFHKVAGREYGASVKLDSQPQALDSKNSVSVVVCLKEIIVFTNGNKSSTLPVKYTGKSCSIHPNGAEVAVGSDSDFYLYQLSNGTLTETKKESNGGAAVTMDYSRDGSNLAVSSDKNVRIFDTSTWEDLTGSWSSHHRAKVTCVTWSPDSKRLMSSSIDSSISLWELGKLKGSKPSVRAHPMSHVNKLRWLDNNTVVTGGQDANLKIWNVSE